METSPRTDDEDEGGAAGARLIPEWGLDADDQVVLAGLVVVAVLALILGWNAWQGSGDGGASAPAGPTVEDVASGADGGEVVAAAALTTTTTEETTSTTAPATTTTSASTTSTTIEVGDVQSAVDSLPGSVSGRADGTVAVLEGYVANAAESREAEAAAAEVAGITEVRNELVLLEPAVTDALAGVGVTGATAIGRGTELSVSGTIDSEADRQPALDAAAAVVGVSRVIDDRLNVSITADLNELPQVQFATNSAEILPVSFDDLDAAADLLASADEIVVEVQGYTDIVGDEARNLTLSQNRAEAVRSYLVGAGVDPDSLRATGFGETDQFGTDLASNRLVRFQQIDG